MATPDSSDRCGVGIRGVAMAIDSFVWIALLFGAVYAVALATGQLVVGAGSVDADLEGGPGLAALGLWLALAIGYHTLAEWRYGSTVGKFLVRIRVTATDGTSPSLWSSLVRNVLRLVDWLPGLYGVAIAAVGLSGSRQRLGDRVGDTVVVRS